MIAAAVYVLCAITSLLCAVLLIRAYRRNRVRLLFWSSWCFAGLALNNLLLMIDRFVPEVDFAAWRALPALIGLLLLIWGMIREIE